MKKNTRLDQIVVEPVDISLKKDQVMASETIRTDDEHYKVELIYEWEKDSLFVTVDFVAEEHGTVRIYKEMGARPSFNQIVELVKEGLRD
jgi:hypothetical protein